MSKNNISKLAQCSVLVIFAVFGISITNTYAISLEEHSVITFESGIPDEISVNGDSDISINNSRYQDGENSLQWDYTNSDQLTIDHPIGYKNNNDTFGIWIYNKTPIDDSLLFEFKHHDQVSVAFEIQMNFEGWRTAWVPFRDMTGEPHVEMDKLVITAPDIEKSSILLDQIILSNPVDDRHPTRDVQVPFVNLEADTSPSAHWQGLYLFDSWLPKTFDNVEVTPNDLKGIEDITERYYDFIIGNKSVVTDEDIRKIQEKFSSYQITRLEDGITGRPVNIQHIFDIYPSQIRPKLRDLTNLIRVREYTEFMLDVAIAYNNADDTQYRETLREIYRDLVEHILDQGWAHGSSLGTMHHLGYELRSFYPSIFLMKEELEEEILKEAQDAMMWFTGMGRIYEDLDESYANIDILNTTLQGMVATILTLDEDAEKVALFNQLRVWLDNGLLPAPGLMPALKVDGSGFHHMGFYPAYARGAYNNMAPVVYFLSRTPFSISEYPHEVLKKAILSMRLYANKYEWILSVTGRHPTGVEKLTSHAYRFMTLAGTPDGKQDIDPEFAAAYLRLVEPDRVDEVTHMIREAGFTAEQDPTGNWTMNYGALALHRRDNWLVGVKGHNRYVWAGELYTDANWYGRYTSYGQIQIMGQKDPDIGVVTNKESGFSHDGWDWNRWPGTTTIHLPFDELKATSFTEMLLSDQTFAGGLNIQGENGMFGMKLREHPKYDYSHQARKSVFMFDDRIIALGSNIENTDAEHSTETTLFQNHMKTEDESIWMSEEGSVGQFPYQDEIQTTESFWMVDNKGNGYYIPEGQKIGLSRSLQHSKHQKNGADTQGMFSTAWIDHGKSPDNEHYEYTILVGADSEKMKEFEKEMNSSSAPYTVLQKDRNAHIVYDQGTQTTGYALFETTENLDVGHIVSVETPSMVMIKEEAVDALVLSTVDPDLRLYEGLDEEQYDKDGNFVGAGPYSRPWIENESIMKSSQMTLKGMWELRYEGNNFRIVSYTDDGNTILEFDYKDALPIEIELLAQSNNGGDDQDEDKGKGEDKGKDKGKGKGKDKGKDKSKGKGKDKKKGKNKSKEN